MSSEQVAVEEQAYEPVPQENEEAPEQQEQENGSAEHTAEQAAEFQAAAQQAALLAAKFSEQGNKRQLDDADGPDAKRQNTINSGVAAGTFRTNPDGTAEFTMQAETTKVGKIIGRSGTTIRELEAKFGVKIQIEHNAAGNHKPVTIKGPSANVEACRDLVGQMLESQSPHELVSGPDTQRTIPCPAGIVGRIIGKGGDTIRALQDGSGAKIKVNQQDEAGNPLPAEQDRIVEVSGKQDAVERAARMVSELITGDQQSVQSIIQKHVGNSRYVQCPKALVGRIIGRGGEIIRKLQKDHRVSIQIEQNADPCNITIAGTVANVSAAEKAVREIIKDSRDTGFGMAGGMGMGGGFNAGRGGFSGGFGGPASGGFGGAYNAPAAAPQFQAGFGNPYGAMPQYGQAGYGAGMGGYAAPQAAPGYGAAAGGYGMPQQAAPAYQTPQGYGQPAQQYGSGYAMPQQQGGAQASADPYAAYQQQQAAAPAAGGAAPASQSVWQELRDDQGRTYYYNSQTGVSQWERPADFR